MFLVQVGEVVKVWANSVEDDFLQFLPAHLGVPKEEIKVYLLTEDLKTWLSTTNNFIDISPTGVAQKFVQVGEEPRANNGSPVQLRALTQWPYDETGKFLGNVFTE